jgi:alanyl-tRNA synthetase
MVKLAAKITGGGGGGNPTRASAGGKDPSKIGEALIAVTAALRQKAG